MTTSRPTLRDVAAAAGVSPMTASNALRGKTGVRESTRAKVLAAAKKLDYRINLTASMLKSGRSNIIHVIVNEFDSPFYSKLTQALSNEIVARGLIPFIEQTRYSADAATHALTTNPFSGQLFDGEIIHAWGLDAHVPVAALNGGRPFVLVDACEETPTLDAVNFPNEEGERAAAQLLIDHGCRNIAIVGHAFAERADLAHAQNAFGLRLRGACGAILDAGLPYDASAVFEAGSAADGITAGHAIARQILDARSGNTDALPPFDGVCCANDYAAFGVIRGLADHGIRVPQDVKVIGFDGVSCGSYATPSLSTVEVNLEQLAKYALDMLTVRIEHQANGGNEDGETLPPSRATIGYRIVERESTATCPSECSGHAL